MESSDEETLVAIKMFRPIQPNAQFLDFQREANMMRTLKHENIVQIYGFMRHPTLIIMEFMNGGSMLNYVSIHKPDLCVENLLNFAAEIAAVS